MRGTESALAATVRVCVLTVLAFVFPVVCGWATGLQALKHWWPGSSSMHGNAALCFVAAAAGLFGSARGSRRTKTVALLAAATIALLSLAERALGAELGGFVMFRRASDDPLLDEDHGMAVATSVSILLFAGGVALRSRWRNGAATGLASATMIGLAATSSLGQASGLTIDDGWGHVTLMSTQSSVALLMLGVGTAAHALLADRQRGDRFSEVAWLPWGAAMLCVCLVLAAWQDQCAAERDGQRRHGAAMAHTLAAAAARFVGDELRAVELLAGRWRQRRPTQAEWEADATSLLNDNPMLEAIEWVDQEHHIRWVVPVVPNSPRQGFDLDQLVERREMLEHARATGRSALTPPVLLAGGGRGFQAIVPLFRAGTFEGCLLGIAGLERVAGLLAGLPQEETGLRLLQAGEVLAERGDSTLAAELGILVPVPLDGIGLNLEVWPVVREQHLTWLLLLPGLLLSVSLGLSLRQLQIGRARNKDLDAIVAAAPVGMLVVDAQGLVRRINSQGRLLFGIAGLSAPLHVEALVPESARPGHAAVRARYLEAAVPRRMGFGRDLRARRLDGTEFPAEIGLAPLVIDHQMCVLVTVVDISDRKRVELVIQQKTDELANANADLQQFAYAASHDLRAPLRAIQNLSKWIAEDAGDKLPKETVELLGLMQSRVARMDALLDGLLTYSRIGRKDDIVESVDLGALSEEVVGMLAPPPGFAVEIRQPMPVIETCRAALQQVLQNLINNAIKHHDRQDGRVVVAADSIDESTMRITVTDDGPGIPVESRERVFEMFQTLKPRDEVEGTGIGLALVRKQVERFGGQVHCTDAPDGRGAQFVVTWARQSTNLIK